MPTRVGCRLPKCPNVLVGRLQVAQMPKCLGGYAVGCPNTQHSQQLSRGRDTNMALAYRHSSTQTCFTISTQPYLLLLILTQPCMSQLGQNFHSIILTWTLSRFIIISFWTNPVQKNSTAVTFVLVIRYCTVYTYSPIICTDHFKTNNQKQHCPCLMVSLPCPCRQWLCVFV